MVLGGATFDEGGPDELSLSVLNLIEVLTTRIHPA